MVNKANSIPEEMTLNEASEFWDSHSVADYPSQIVQFEVESKDRKTFVAIEQHLLEELEKRARENGVSVETLINLWIQEKLAPVR
jgi:predicted DNA binding CopG/RHH family protein